MRPKYSAVFKSKVEALHQVMHAASASGITKEKQTRPTASLTLKTGSRNSKFYAVLEPDRGEELPSSNATFLELLR